MRISDWSSDVCSSDLIEMPAGDVTQRIDHGDDGQAEGEGHADKADAKCGKGGGQHGGAAATQHPPERTEAFGRQSAGPCTASPSDMRVMRAEERRGGKEGVSTVRTRWGRDH